MIKELHHHGVKYLEQNINNEVGKMISWLIPSQRYFFMLSENITIKTVLHKIINIFNYKLRHAYK